MSDDKMVETCLELGVLCVDVGFCFAAFILFGVSGERVDMVGLRGIRMVN